MSKTIFRTTHIKNFLACPMTWILGELWGVPPQDKAVFSRGTAIHKQIELWLTEGKHSPVIDRLPAVVCERHPHQHIEEKIQWETPEFVLTGQADYYRIDGDLLILRDWKTCGNIAKNGREPEELAEDIQMINYAMILMTQNRDVTRVQLEHVTIGTEEDRVEHPTIIVDRAWVFERFQRTVEVIESMLLLKKSLDKTSRDVIPYLPEHARPRKCHGCVFDKTCLHSPRSGDNMKAKRPEPMPPATTPATPPAGFAPGECESLLMRLQSALPEADLELVDRVLSHIGKPKLIDQPPEKRIAAIDWMSSAQGKAKTKEATMPPTAPATPPTGSVPPILISRCFVSADSSAYTDLAAVAATIETSAQAALGVPHSRALPYEGWRGHYVLGFTQFFRSGDHKPFILIPAGVYWETEAISAFLQVYPSGNQIRGCA